MGLSLCRRLLKTIDSKITVHAVHKQGSHFTLSIPVTLPETSQRTSDEKFFDAIHPKRLLFVDGYPSLQLQIECQLTREPVKTQYTSHKHLDNFLTHYHEGIYSIIWIIDPQNPIDLEELIVQFQKNRKQFPLIRWVLAYPSGLYPFVIENLQQLNAFGYLNIPFSPHKFAETVLFGSNIEKQEKSVLRISKDLPEKDALLWIIDDHPFHLKGLKRLFSQWNVNSFLIHHPERAIKLAKHGHPKLILIDLNMPTMDGIECALQLKKLSHLNDCPLILVSSHFSAQVIKRINSLPFQIAGWEEKPISQKTAQKLIETYLKHSVDPTLHTEKPNHPSMEKSSSWTANLYVGYVKEAAQFLQSLLELEKQPIRGRDTLERNLRKEAHKLTATTAYCGLSSLSHELLLFSENKPPYTDPLNKEVLLQLRNNLVNSLTKGLQKPHRIDKKVEVL